MERIHLHFYGAVHMRKELGWACCGLVSLPAEQLVMVGSDLSSGLCKASEYLR